MKMKYVLLIFAIVICTSAQAQRFGYVYADSILQKMPEYKEAESELLRQSELWQKQVNEKERFCFDLQSKYQAEKVLLNDALKEQREEQIKSAQEDFITFRNSIFGYEGALFKKRMELMRPLQDKVYEAIRKVSKKYKLDFMFDRSSDFHILYVSDPVQYNFTDFVLRELGIEKPK